MGDNKKPSKGKATTLYLNPDTWGDYKAKCPAVMKKSGSARMEELMERDLLAITKPPAAALLYWKELQVLLNGKLDPKLVEAVLAVYTGLAVGPTLGGVLVQAFGWRSIFYINVPIVGQSLSLAIMGAVAATVIPPQVFSAIFGGVGSTGSVSADAFLRGQV